MHRGHLGKDVIGGKPAIGFQEYKIVASRIRDGTHPQPQKLSHLLPKCLDVKSHGPEVCPDVSRVCTAGSHPETSQRSGTFLTCCFRQVLKRLLPNVNSVGRNDAHAAATINSGMVIHGWSSHGVAMTPALKPSIPSP